MKAKARIAKSVNSWNANRRGRVEIEIDGHLSRSFQIRFGAGYEKTKITDPGALGLQGIGIEEGSRILGTPAWNVSLGGVYTRTLTSTIDGGNIWRIAGGISDGRVSSAISMFSLAVVRQSGR
jgi:hypothetical protein